MRTKDKILVRKIRKCARVPFRATAGSAGFDVCAAVEKDVVLEKNETTKIPSGIAICLPNKNFVALLLPRSGLSIHNGITLANGVGVIDSDFRGEIIVALRNFSNEDYTLCPGEKIAQILFFNLVDFVLEVTDEELSETQRGSDGLGSTGKI